MNIHHIAKWAHNESQMAYGEYSAWVKCHDEMKRMIDDDDLETKTVLESVPEPSSAERAEWPQATKNYVEMLESLVDGRIHNKGDTQCLRQT